MKFEIKNTGEAKIANLANFCTFVSCIFALLKSASDLIFRNPSSEKYVYIFLFLSLFIVFLTYEVAIDKKKTIINPKKIKFVEWLKNEGPIFSAISMILYIISNFISFLLCYNI